MWLRTWRERERLTLQAFGGRVGVGGSAVAKWEAGRIFPRPEQIDAIKAATDGAVTCDDLLDCWREANRTPVPQAAAAT